ncbi:MAG: hypothetical protein ABIR79_16530 [Candidatus Binatia bacterium]
MQPSEVLDRAKSVTGSDKATAEALGVSPQRLSDWRAGTRPFPLVSQAKACELAGMTESEQQRYVWEVIRARMGKPIGAALGGAGWIGSTGVGFALLVASLGERAATMYKPFRAQRGKC